MKHNIITIEYYQLQVDISEMPRILQLLHEMFNSITIKPLYEITVDDWISVITDVITEEVTTISVVNTTESKVMIDTICTRYGINRSILADMPIYFTCRSNIFDL